MLHWIDVSWKESGSSLVQEVSFALPSDGKLNQYLTPVLHGRRGVAAAPVPIWLK